MDCKTAIQEFLNDCDVHGISFADRNTILRLWSDRETMELSVKVWLASQKGIRYDTSNRRNQVTLD